MSRPTTPGAGGYLLAVLVAIAVTVVLLALTWTSLASPGRFAAALVVLTVYVTVFAVPAALIGVPLVHLCCRRVEAQWVHVLVAGLAGVLTGVTFGAVAVRMAGGHDVASLALVLGSAAAIGRASVIPLVRRPEPVDDDFPAERPRC